MHTGDTAAASMDGHGRVVVAPRELDVAAQQALWPKIEAAMMPDSALLLDMSGCEFVDSIGLGMIVRAARELRGRRSRLAVIGLAGQPAELFRTTRVASARELALFDGEAEARKALGLSPRAS